MDSKLSISCKADAAKFIYNSLEQLKSLFQDANMEFMEKINAYNAIYGVLINDVIGSYYMCLSEAEKDVLVNGIILYPFFSGSSLFSEFYRYFYRIGKLANQTLSETVFKLFKRFFEKRIVSILEETTVSVDYESKSSMMMESYNEEMISNLLHLPDLINNLQPQDPSSIFHYTNYPKLVNESLLSVFICFNENRSKQLYKLILQRECNLNYQDALATSLIEIVTIYVTKQLSPATNYLRCFSNQVLISLLQKYISLVPKCHLPSLIDSILSSFLHSSYYEMLKPSMILFLFIPSSASYIAQTLIRYEFDASLVMGLLDSVYNRELSLSISDFSALSSYGIILYWVNCFKSPAFCQQHSNEQQKRLLSLLYLVLNLQLTFVISTPKESPIIDSIMSGVSKHLGTPVDEVKVIIIGIARSIAVLVSPDTQYNWPECDLSELDEIVKRIRNVKKADVIEEKADSTASNSEMAKEMLIDSTEMKKKRKEYIDVDSVVDFYTIMNSTIENAILEEADNSDDSDDSFIPYDLTEDQSANQPDDHKEYHFLLEPLGNLSNEDSFIRRESWKGLVSIVTNDKVEKNSRDIETVASYVVEMNGLQGNNDFWPEYIECLGTLIYLNPKGCMEKVFSYSRKNSRNNMTVQKCVILLQCVYNAALWLYEGKPKEKRKEDIVPVKEIVAVRAENHLIKQGKTTYRASYYANHVNQIGTKNENTLEKSVNAYSSICSVFLHPLLTWCLRFPPRNEECIANLVMTISLLATMPVPSAVFDDCYRDIAVILLRYRFNSSPSIRRSVLELFITTTKYKERRGISRECLEIQNKDRVIEWMTNVCDTDVDDLCRSLAYSILKQIRSSVC